MEVTAILEEVELTESATITTTLPGICSNPTTSVLSNSNELSCQGQVRVELSWSFAGEQKPVDLDIRFSMFS